MNGTSKDVEVGIKELGHRTNNDEVDYTERGRQSMKKNIHEQLENQINSNQKRMVDSFA